MMLKLRNGKFVSDEGSNGISWQFVPESAVSYGMYLESPSKQREAQINQELIKADNEDRAEADAAGTRMGLIDYPTPRVDAVKAKLGKEWEAYSAYCDFAAAGADNS